MKLCCELSNTITLVAIEINWKQFVESPPLHTFISSFISLYNVQHASETLFVQWIDALAVITILHFQLLAASIHRCNFLMFKFYWTYLAGFQLRLGQCISSMPADSWTVKFWLACNCKRPTLEISISSSRSLSFLFNSFHSTRLPLLFTRVFSFVHFVWVSNVWSCVNDVVD